MIRATAINNVNTREKDDFYATPAWCTRALLKRIDALPIQADKLLVLDPCCGDGAVLMVVRDHWPHAALDGIEINVERAHVNRNGAYIVSQGDFLGDEGASLRQFNTENPADAHTWIITNPPYSKALEFAEACLATPVRQGVALLLPINWLGSVRRHEFLRKNTPALWVLSKRPSFINGSTAASEYAWFVWSKHIPPTVEILPLEVSIAKDGATGDYARKGAVK